MTTGPGSSAAATDPIELYCEELRRWGERINLVGSSQPAALQVHLDDSLAAAPHLVQGSRVADLGSGAGLPGIPIAIARPDLRLTLVEIRERRVHFLRHAVRVLGLDCEILRRRLEDGPGEPFDVALLRAVAPPPKAVPLARPWIHAGGELWLWSREAPTDLPWPVRAVIPLSPDRGSILRLRGADVACGTG